MIHPQDPSNALESAIDRLVDGCLAEPERRKLLLRLETEADGWRRCALAFLEDQAWRSALASPAEVKQPEPQVLTLKPRRPWSLVLRQGLAASLIALTFAIGFASGGAMRKPVEVAVSHDPIPPPSKAVDTQIREVGWLDVVDPSAGESPPERVPILAGPVLDDKWLRDQPPAVSDYVKAQWERQGYQVEERRRLVSLVLADGRQVSIPVDEVAVKYVGQYPF